MRQKEPDKTTKDLVAFVILALREIAAGIEKSVTAWEKRGYWVKADKYRMDWEWSREKSQRACGSFQAGGLGDNSHPLTGNHATIPEHQSERPS